MWRRVCLSVAVAIMVLMMVALPVFASYKFYFIVSVTDTSGTDRTYVPVMLGFGGYNISSSGYMTSTGTDTQITAGTTTAQSYLLNRAEVNAVITTIPANSTTNLYFYTGYDPVQTSFPVVVGHDGYITMRNNPTLDPGDTYEIEIQGYFDLSAINVGGILDRGVASIRISCGAVNRIDVWVNGAIRLQEAGLTSGLHTLKITSDGANMRMWWDTIEVDDDPALVVVDNNANYVIGNYNALPYINYFTEKVGINEVVHYHPSVMLGGDDYSTGTVTLAADATVVGAGTVFNQEMVGGLFEGVVDGVLYTIASVTDANNLELTIPFAGAPGGGLAYAIYPRLIDTHANQDGIITWGANDGLVITYGTILPYIYNSGGTTVDEGFTPPTSVMPPNWTASGGNLDSPPADSIWVQISQMLDFPATEGGIPKTSQAILIYFMVVIGFTVMTLIKTKSMFITIVIMIAFLGVGSSLTLIPGWLVFVVAIGGIGLLFLYKQAG